MNLDPTGPYRYFVPNPLCNSSGKGDSAASKPVNPIENPDVQVTDLKTEQTAWALYGKSLLITLPEQPKL